MTGSVGSKNEQYQEQGGGSSAARSDIYSLVWFPHCIKNANGGILKNQNRGLAGWKKWFIIDSKKWVFTVQLATACPFLSYCQNIVQWIVKN